MATVKGLHDCIHACNGEIRLQAVRYGIGWYCLILTTEAYDNEVFERFEDLICGDNDYFNARDYFQEKIEYTLEIGETPSIALNKAEIEAAQKLEGWNN